MTTSAKMDVDPSSSKMLFSPPDSEYLLAVSSEGILNPLCRFTLILRLHGRAQTQFAMSTFQFQLGYPSPNTGQDQERVVAMPPSLQLKMMCPFPRGKEDVHVWESFTQRTSMGIEPLGAAELKGTPCVQLMCAGSTVSAASGMLGLPHRPREIFDCRPVVVGTSGLHYLENWVVTVRLLPKPSKALPPLHEEILVQIFDMACSLSFARFRPPLDPIYEREEVVLRTHFAVNYALVCRQWKEVLESHRFLSKVGNRLSRIFWSSDFLSSWPDIGNALRKSKYLQGVILDYLPLVETDTSGFFHALHSGPITSRINVIKFANGPTSAQEWTWYHVFDYLRAGRTARRKIEVTLVAINLSETNLSGTNSGRLSMLTSSQAPSILDLHRSFLSLDIAKALFPQGHRLTKLKLRKCWRGSVDFSASLIHILRSSASSLSLLLFDGFPSSISDNQELGPNEHQINPEDLRTAVRDCRSLNWLEIDGGLYAKHCVNQGVLDALASLPHLEHLFLKFCVDIETSSKHFCEAIRRQEAFSTLKGFQLRAIWSGEDFKTLNDVCQTKRIQFFSKDTDDEDMEVDG